MNALPPELEGLITACLLANPFRARDALAWNATSKTVRTRTLADVMAHAARARILLWNKRWFCPHMVQVVWDADDCELVALLLQHREHDILTRVESLYFRSTPYAILHARTPRTSRTLQATAGDVFSQLSATCALPNLRVIELFDYQSPTEGTFGVRVFELFLAAKFRGGLPRLCEVALHDPTPEGECLAALLDHPTIRMWKHLRLTNLSRIFVEHLADALHEGRLSNLARISFDEVEEDATDVALALMDDLVAHQIRVTPP